MNSPIAVLWANCCMWLSYTAWQWVPKGSAQARYRGRAGARRKPRAFFPFKRKAEDITLESDSQVVSKALELKLVLNGGRCHLT